MLAGLLRRETGREASERNDSARTGSGPMASLKAAAEKMGLSLTDGKLSREQFVMGLRRHRHARRFVLSHLLSRSGNSRRLIGGWGSAPATIVQSWASRTFLRVRRCSARAMSALRRPLSRTLGTGLSRSCWPPSSSRSTGGWRGMPSSTYTSSRSPASSPTHRRSIGSIYF